MYFRQKLKQQKSAHCARASRRAAHTVKLPTYPHTLTQTHTHEAKQSEHELAHSHEHFRLVHTHTHIHARSMLDRAPQQFVGYARDTHTHTHICANLLTELVPTQTLAHETQWESGRARF